MSAPARNKQGKPFSRKPAAVKSTSPERLTCVAIVRGGQTLSDGSLSHAQLRNYEPERPGDVCGFMTSTGRFVTRAQAKMVGEKSGQVRPGQLRELLSSDINWKGKPHAS